MSAVNDCYASPYHPRICSNIHMSVPSGEALAFLLDPQLELSYRSADEGFAMISFAESA